ncbi:MAG: major capsid protein, partial [Sphaerochaetaceae bacterium]
MARTGLFGGFSFDPEVFTGYISERDPINPQLINSGVVRPADARVANSLANENNVVTIRFYQPFNGDALNYDGVTNNAPVTLEGSSMTAMAYRRMKAWKEQDFTHELTGANDLANVARSVGAYQAKENQKSMLSILKGLEGVSDFASHVNNVALATSGTVKDVNRLTPDTAIVAMQEALGDHMEEFQVWFMHSAVFTDLVRQGFATDVVIKDGKQSENPFVKYFLGKPVIIDDTATAVSNTTSGKVEYHTYLLGTGLFVTAPVRIDTPNYVDYDPETTGGVQKLYSKWGRLLHPYGFSFDAESAVAESPTNA